jgi:hypothetical protein
MSATIPKNEATSDIWTTPSPQPEDSAAMTAMRSSVAGMKGKLEGTGDPKLPGLDFIDQRYA